MSSRRQFLQMLSVAAGTLGGAAALSRAEASTDMMYDPPRFGNLSLLQIGDTHGQLLPGHFRESSFYMGVGDSANRPPYLVGDSFCEHFRVMPQTLRAHAHSPLYFEDLARVFGRTGGYAHLATVIKRLRASRRDSLLLDCGDSWLGSGLAYRTRGQCMVEASRALEIDAMTGDWEFAFGFDRLREILEGPLRGRTTFVAQNARIAGKVPLPLHPYSVFFVGGIPVGVVGEAYPHLGRSGSRNFAPELTVGIDEAQLQDTVDLVRARGVRCVVLLSHAGLPADLKLAGRISGIDVILSGHSHDALPEAMIVKARTGKTLVTSVGAHGKFVGVLDLELRDGRVRDFRFRLVPIFANLIPADIAMQTMIASMRAPYADEFGRTLAVSETMLYRRHNFMGTFDQLVLQALLSARNADIAFGPGYRWGETLLPGQTLTVESVLDLLAVPDSSIRNEVLTGEAVRNRLENWLDGTFNADPYLQTGEDMVRALGLTYRCDPAARNGGRTSEIHVRGKPLRPDGVYRVVSWGLPGEGTREPTQVWQVVTDYLVQTGVVKEQAKQLPVVAGVESNLGVF